MRRLSYNPKILAYVQRLSDGQIYNLSDDIIDGSVTRRLDGISDVRLKLQNKQGKYLGSGNNKLNKSSRGMILTPMDKIVVYMGRITDPFQVFGGYLDEVPAFQLYPDAVNITASCTLKRIKYTFFDPGIPAMMQYFAKFGFMYDPSSGLLSDPRSRFGNYDMYGGAGELLKSVLVDIGSWDPASVNVKNLPPAFIKGINQATKKYGVSSTLDLGTKTYTYTHTGEPVDPVNLGPGLPANAATTDRWITDALNGIKAPLTQQNVCFLKYWAYWEDNRTPEQAGYQDGDLNKPNYAPYRFNWLNSTNKAQGSWDYNDNGNNPVQGYPTYEIGIAQTIRNLQATAYHHIIPALRSGNPLSYANQDGLHTDLNLWGTGAHYDQIISMAGKCVTKNQMVVPAAGDVVDYNDADVWAKQLIDEAKKYLGVRYVWGGATPAGFDCSGLIVFLYDKLFGITLPHHAATMFSYGEVDVQVRPGDLVFFGNPIHHMGIYIGSNKYLHAPQTNDVVKISEFRNRSDFVGAKRIVPRSDATGNKNTPVNTDSGAKSSNYQFTWPLNNNVKMIANEKANRKILSKYPHIRAANDVDVTHIWPPILDRLEDARKDASKKAGKTLVLDITAGYMDKTMAVNGELGKERKLHGTGLCVDVYCDHVAITQNQYFSAGLGQKGVDFWDQYSLRCAKSASSSLFFDEAHLDVLLPDLSGPDTHYFQADTPSANYTAEEGSTGKEITTTYTVSAPKYIRDKFGSMSSIANGYVFQQLASPDSTLSAMLTGKRALANDISLFEWVKEFAKGSGRTFCSAPNGNFMAFFPDYFGWFNTTPYFYVSDIEIVDLNIQLTDNDIATHVYGVGPLIGFTSIQPIDVAQSAVASIQEEAFRVFIQENEFGDLPFNEKDFLARYGARPSTIPLTTIRNPGLLWMATWLEFMKQWAGRYRATAQFTFMPELFPGGRINIGNNVEMFINSVTHTFSYQNGFSTSADLTAATGINESLAAQVTRTMSNNSQIG